MNVDKAKEILNEVKGSVNPAVRCVINNALAELNAVQDAQSKQKLSLVLESARCKAAEHAGPILSKPEPEDSAGKHCEDCYNWMKMPLCPKEKGFEKSNQEAELECIKLCDGFDQFMEGKCILVHNKKLRAIMKERKLNSVKKAVDDFELFLKGKH